MDQPTQTENGANRVSCRMLVSLTPCVIVLTAFGSSVALGQASNDACSSAAPIATGILTPFNTASATTDGQTLAPSCDPGPEPDDQIYNDLWFCWTAPTAGTFDIELIVFPSALARVAVYDGCACPALSTSAFGCTNHSNSGSIQVSSLTVVAGDDFLIRIGGQDPSVGPIQGAVQVTSALESPTNITCDDTTAGQVTVSWDLPTGVSYSNLSVVANGGQPILLSGSDTMTTFPIPAGFVGPFQVCVFGVGPNGQASGGVCCATYIGGPPNDVCANAELVATGSASFDNTFAQTEMPIVADCEGPVGSTDVISNDLWFRFVSQVAGDVTFETCGSTFDTKLFIYEEPTNCAFIDASLIGCNGDACGLQSRIVIPALAGDSFLVRVASEDFPLPTTGPGTLLVDVVPTSSALFRRGDANNDGQYSLSDAVALLSALFVATSTIAIDCEDALDANDDGALNLSDPIALLSALFGIPPSPLPEPYPDCGPDPTAGDGLDCTSYDVSANCP